MAFSRAHPALGNALVARSYAVPTPVQAAVLQPESEGRDLIVSAQTGSGKTVAYGLALAPTLLGTAQTFPQAGAPLALVIAPTRELALQVCREFEWLYADTGARIVSMVGGMDIRRERRALDAGCHIVVGTPGRLRDHLEKGSFDPSGLTAVVLDEADEMLDLGFREDLEFILESAPATRRTLLFSATIPRPIVALAKAYQRDALRLDVASDATSHADIEYRAIRLAPNDIERAVVNLLRFYEAPAAMVFCSTREAVRHLYGALQERGFAAVALSGELSQHDRTTALQAIRDGRARICVATDVAARGIDVPDLALVIHADLPNDAETLLHRSGRTGRAGRKGVCVLLAPYTRRRKAEMLIHNARIEVEWSSPPTAEQIRALDQERMLADPVIAENQSEEDLALGRALLAGRPAEELAAALVRLYRARLPEPEEMFEAGSAPQRERPARRGEGPAGGDQHGAPPARLGPDEVVWFRMSVGRNRNADPRWLIPLICRLGHITKKDIGAIRIFDRDTRFEISREAAPKFAAAVRKADDEEVRIEPATEETARPRAGRPDRPERAPRKPPRTGAGGPAEAGDRPPREAFGEARGETRGEGRGEVRGEGRPPRRRMAGPAEGKSPFAPRPDRPDPAGGPKRPGKRERVRAARRSTNQSDD
ncbi:DEAD/DEAH box helicase [Prosthecomicrobium hirschii]|uniref:DEAD/DEAH box helicase n=1 Tax=Prosthecodimorpha hirschii TaxID=665126 RepID=UPI00221FE3A4|nr:DEAD/DEAH box helicase [Prosthecomicrobium hirschii]MCW1839487.1 DEAD/DEAH box helicase [Prosthecomicrobium hirschii]